MTTNSWPYNESTDAGPLAGVKIVDMTSVGMGPYATQILGDMGADVIKVEAPEGDVFRHSEPARSPGMGPLFMQFNRNKRSFTLDVKKAADLQALLDLLKEADVLISNVRPRSLRKFALDYENLHISNPRLIYCAAVGFGQAGPYAEKPAFDDIIQAMSGLAHFQGYSNSGAPTYIKTLLADKIAGLTLAYTIPMALYEREKSGLGQAIEVPMYETLVSFTLAEHMAGESFVPSLGEMGYMRVLSPHRRPYRTSDGYIALLPLTDAQWRRFFSITGRADLASDSRFACGNTRTHNFDALCAELAAMLVIHSTQEWIDLLDKADVPVARVNTPQDLLNDPHLRAVGFFKEFEHPTEGPIRLMDIPAKFSRTPGKIRRLPSKQGADQTQVQANLK